MDHVAPSSAAQRLVKVHSCTPMARDTYRLSLADPEMARAIRPGQFLMIRPGLGSDPLLGRPFALYDAARINGSGLPTALEVVFLVVGRGTEVLSKLRTGDTVSVWGPLGNGFGPPPRGHVILVAGGIGQTPFLALAKWWMGKQSYGEPIAFDPIPKVTLLYGARSVSYLAGLDDFQEVGVEVEVATDNGTAGHHGFVTDLLSARLKRGGYPAKVIGCGPEPMLAALSRLTEKFGIDCELSLENHMACGFGVCFSCVAPIRQDDGTTDLRRVCVEGPIFPAKTVVFS